MSDLFQLEGNSRTLPPIGRSIPKPKPYGWGDRGSAHSPLFYRIFYRKKTMLLGESGRGLVGHGLRNVHHVAKGASELFHSLMLQSGASFFRCRFYCLIYFFTLFSRQCFDSESEKKVGKDKGRTYSVYGRDVAEVLDGSRSQKRFRESDPSSRYKPMPITQFHSFKSFSLKSLSLKGFMKERLGCGFSACLQADRV